MSTSAKRRAFKDQLNNGETMVHDEAQTAAGIYLDADGKRVVGGSVRADGTVRKMVRVRPGYTPQEDVKRYSVREAREARLNPSHGDGKSSTAQSSRQLGALNSFLEGNAVKAKAEHSQRTASSPKKEARDTSKKPGKKGNSSEDLTDTLAGLSLSEGTAKVSLSAEKPPTPSSSKKKYTPPQRRKKYTIADLG